jgi:hypothetical protein
MAMLAFDALVDLVEALRQQGYDVGPRECLAAQRLLLALQAQHGLPADAADWATLLAPVFCGSRLEQQAFGRDYRTWLARQGQGYGAQSASESTDTGPHRPTPGIAWPTPLPTPAPAAPAPAGAAAPGPRSAPWRALRAVQAAALVLGLLLGMLLGALVAWGWYGRPVDVVVQVTTTTDARSTVSTDCPSCQVVSSPDGAHTLTLRRWNLPLAITVQAGGHCSRTEALDWVGPLPPTLGLVLQPEPCTGTAAPVAVPPTRSAQLPQVLGQQVATTPARPHLGWQVAGAAVPALLCALGLAVLGWRTRLALGSAATAAPPALKALRLRQQAAELFDRATLRRVAQDLRRHRPTAMLEIDANATVTATVAAGGLFTPVLLQRHALPEYLVLIDQASARDHAAQAVTALMAQMADNGVAIDRWYYHRDPRQCQSAFNQPSRTSLADLQARHPGHVLLLFGTGEGLFDVLSGEPLPWLATLAAWPRRVLLTPLPPARWGWHEATLRGLGFDVVTADLAGLQQLANPEPARRADPRTERSFPALLRDGDARWTERAAPPAAEQDKLAAQLKWFLGPRGYQWLCALALYPQLHWEVTLHLGQRLLADSTELRTLLASLLQLPWLRLGQLPPWLRLRLAADLGAEPEGRARAAYAELLGQAGSDLQIEVAADAALGLSVAARLRSAWRGWRQHAQALDAARRSHPDSPLRDYPFVSFMRGEKPTQLEMAVPDSWRRLFERGWLPTAPQAVVATLLAALLGIAAWWGTGHLVTRPLDISALHLTDDGWLVVLQRVGEPLWLNPDQALARPFQDLPALPGVATLAKADALGGRGTAWPLAMALTPDGRWAAAVDAQDGVEVRPLPPVTTAERVRGGVAATGTGPMTTFELSPDGRHLLMARKGATLMLASWDDSGGVRLWPLPGDGPPALHALGPRHLALADPAGNGFALYRPGTPRQSQGVPLQMPDRLTALALSADGRWLAAGDASGRIKRWAIDGVPGTTDVVGSAGSAITRLAFSADGSLLASADARDGVLLWDPDTQERLALATQAPDSPVTQLAIHPDRTRLAAATAQGGLLVWRLTPPPPASAPAAANSAAPATDAAAVPAPPASALPATSASTAASVPPPARLVLTAQPANIAAGQTVQLCFSAQGGTAQAITPAVKGFEPGRKGCVAVRPEASTSYRIDGRGDAGQPLSARATVAVRQAAAPGAPPRILAFTVLPGEVERGGTVQLCWRVANVGRVSVSGTAIDNLALGPGTTTADGIEHQGCTTVTAGSEGEQTFQLQAMADGQPPVTRDGLVRVYTPRIWCCVRGAGSTTQANPTAQQQQPALKGQQAQQQLSLPNPALSSGSGRVLQTEATECRRLGGLQAATREAAEQQCSGRDELRLLGLRTRSGEALVIRSDARSEPVELQAEVDLTLRSADSALLALTLHHSFGTRGTCVDGGRVVMTATQAVQGSGRQRLMLRLPATLPREFQLSGFLGVSARLLPLTRAPDTETSQLSALAEARQSPIACLPYQPESVVDSRQSEACVAGFVLRQAYQGDPVCVTPATRAQVQADNAAAERRRAPEGSNFAPDNCRAGFVWREATITDHVCVTPEVRAQTADDNRRAASRRLQPGSSGNLSPSTPIR